MTLLIPHADDAESLRALVDWLIQYRIQVGMSQRQVALRMGCSNSTVHYIEQRAKEPSVPMLQAYARALGGRLNVEFLLPPGGVA